MSAADVTFDLRTDKNMLKRRKENDTYLEPGRCHSLSFF